VPWQDFREFLGELERVDDIRLLEGVDPDLELGTLTELMCERNGPMLLFDRIAGYPPGYRVAAKPYTTPLRSAIALGLPTDISPFQMFQLWREKVRDYRPIQPEVVATGPVTEHVAEGAEVELTRFPAPRWHERDGGQYLGTGCAVITRDPDDGWVNVGTYRCMLHDAATLGVDSSPYHHATLQMQRWWSLGKSCPVAVAISVDPYLFWASSLGLPWGTQEYEYAGFLKGAPIPVIFGARTGLPLPANAELIVEGEIPPASEEQRLEGPFGEYTGYYAGGERNRPVIRVQATYHRTDPILHGEPPLKPPSNPWVCPPASSTLRVWDGLEKTGIPGVKGVYALRTGESLTTVVSIRQQYAGHAKQVGLAASGMLHSQCRVLVVVEEDVDPSNPEAVLWAIATRTDPVTSFEIQHGSPSNVIDPMIPPDRKRRGDLTTNRALIIACRPWEWQDEFPPINRASDALRRRVADKWRHLFS
jgi:4-hydroxy-3-polyprenylbenzoate decarboxylase